MKTYKIAVIKGDGIGPEIIDATIEVLDALGQKENINFEYKQYLMGGIAVDKTGEPLPQETIDGSKDADATLFGAIGGEKWDSLPRHLRPESGLLKLRKELGLYANIRPAMVFDELVEASSLKESVVKGVDLIVVRELTGGIYFGQPREKGTNRAFNTMVYETHEIERIAHIAFALARKRKSKVCSIDKANVLEVSQLWREVVENVAKSYKDVALSHMYIDNASMQLIKDPRQFDIILTSNLFGDILSDEASMLTGSIGLLPSASIGDKHKLYEPIHGSAPDIAGQNLANPIATILSASMMLKDLGEDKLASKIESAVKKTLKDGVRTGDIANFGAKKICGTKEMAEIIKGNL